VADEFGEAAALDSSSGAERECVDEVEPATPLEPAGQVAVQGLDSQPGDLGGHEGDGDLASDWIRRASQRVVAVAMPFMPCTITKYLYIS
jgi:hypothetical protein